MAKKTKTTSESLTATQDVYADSLAAETIDVFGADSGEGSADSSAKKVAYILYADDKDAYTASNYTSQYFTARGLTSNTKKISELTDEELDDIIANGPLSESKKYESLALCGIGSMSTATIKNLYRSYGDKLYIFECDASKIVKINNLAQIKGLRLASRSISGCVYCYLYDPTDSSYDDDNDGTASSVYPDDISALNKYVTCNYADADEYTTIASSVNASSIITSDELNDLISNSSVDCKVCLTNTYISSVPALCVFNHKTVTTDAIISSNIDGSKYYAVVSFHKPSDKDWQIDITNVPHTITTVSGTEDNANSLYYTYNGDSVPCESYLPYQIISQNSTWTTLSLNYKTLKTAYANVEFNDNVSASAKAIAFEKAEAAKTALDSFETAFINELNNYSLATAVSKYKGKGSSIAAHGTMTLTQFYNILKSRSI